METPYHIPVLCEQSIDLLLGPGEGVYADLTLGGGGHSRAILRRLGPAGQLFGFDRDADALVNAPHDPRFTPVESDFRFLRGALRTLGTTQLDGVLADLGVSSHHFDAPERGFSFRFDAPLDMRMNQRGGRTAADILEKYSVDELTRILGTYGEIATPWKVAGCLKRAGKIETTQELVEAVAPCTPARDRNGFLSRLFQALRIETNREMEALEMALEQSLKLLRPGGRLVVISYHSLEDRLVKNFLKSGHFKGTVEKDFFGKPQTPFELLTRKAIVPSEEEIQENPRARSAKLRAAAKL